MANDVELSDWNDTADKYETWYMVGDTPVKKTGDMTQSGQFKITNVQWADTYASELISALEGVEYQIAVNPAASTYVVLLSGAISGSTTTNLDQDTDDVYFYVSVGSGGALSFKTTGAANCSYNANAGGTGVAGVIGNFRIQAKDTDNEETGSGTGEDHENDALVLTVKNGSAQPA